MSRSLEQIEKHTIVSRLSVSIYKMDEAQLIELLNSLEGKPALSSSGDAAELPDKGPGLRRQMIIARIFILINQLDKDSLLLRLRSFKHSDFKWVREYPRLACYIMVDFATSDKVYRSCIRDISASGVFIETTESFKIGQEVSLCFTLSESDAQLPFKASGKVARIYPDGIGVQYTRISQYQRDILDALVKQIPG